MYCWSLLIPLSPVTSNTIEYLPRGCFEKPLTLYCVALPVIVPGPQSISTGVNAGTHADQQNQAPSKSATFRVDQFLDCLACVLLTGSKDAQTPPRLEEHV